MHIHAESSLNSQSQTPQIRKWQRISGVWQRTHTTRLQIFVHNSMASTNRDLYCVQTHHLRPSPRLKARQTPALKWIGNNSHLLCQKVLVLPNCAFPRLHLALITYPDLLRHLIYQSEVMADKDKSSLWKHIIRSSFSKLYCDRDTQ